MPLLIVGKSSSFVFPCVELLSTLGWFHPALACGTAVPHDDKRAVGFEGTANGKYVYTSGCVGVNCDLNSSGCNITSDLLQQLLQSSMLDTKDPPR